MSGQLRVLKDRIRSVENTKKITRAMEMVAAAKLHRFQDMMAKGQAYAAGLGRLLARLSAAKTDFTHPFLERREEKKTALVLMTSDTGLCGTYNSDLTEIAKRFLAAANGPLKLIGIGKHGIHALERANYSFHKKFIDIRASRIEEILQEMRDNFSNLYLQGEVDSIYVIYSRSLSAMTYENVVEKLLPLERPDKSGPDEKKGAPADYIYEPDETTILSRLIPLFFEAKTRQIFLEAFVSEQIARMRAMHQATENASEMITDLVLRRNKARQAAITRELIEIISGSQALKN